MLYVGVKNDLQTRLEQHWEEAQEKRKSFVGRYNCFHLIYWERYDDPTSAIDREKQLKKWSRVKKENLINKANPHWYFLDHEIEE